jgi:hypothetical protein
MGMKETNHSCCGLIPQSTNMTMMSTITTPISELQDNKRRGIYKIAKDLQGHHQIVVA